MPSYEISTETHYLVLQKQRTDPEVVLTPRHQALQIKQARLDDEEINTRFSADDFRWQREIPVGEVKREIPVQRYWRHGKR